MVSELPYENLKLAKKSARRELASELHMKYLEKYKNQK